MDAIELKAYAVNGKVFVVDEDGILRQCELLPPTVMPTFQEISAIFEKADAK